MLRVAISNVPLLRFGASRIRCSSCFISVWRAGSTRRHWPSGGTRRAATWLFVGSSAMMVSARKPIAAAGGIVEAHLIAGGEAGDQRAHAVRVAQIEVRDASPARAPHPACRAAATSPGWRTTCRAPGHRHASAAWKLSSAARALRTVDRRQHRESRQHVGHVLPGVELRLGPRNAVGAAVPPRDTPGRRCAARAGRSRCRRSGTDRCPSACS